VQCLTALALVPPRSLLFLNPDSRPHGCGGKFIPVARAEPVDSAVPWDNSLQMLHISQSLFPKFVLDSTLNTLKAMGKAPFGSLEPRPAP
jgi:hypothetical protein